MCGGSEQLNSSTQASSLKNNRIESVESEHSFSALLELAANNDVKGFRQSVVGDPRMVDEAALWYAHQKASKRTVLLRRTPLMVASMYASVEIVKLILSVSNADVNRSSDSHGSAALHCAASGGAVGAIDVVELLLLAGADPSATDCWGFFPFDVIVLLPSFSNQCVKWMIFMFQVLLQFLVHRAFHHLKRMLSLSSLCCHHVPEKNTLLISRFLTSEPAFMAVMSSGCFHSRSGHVHGHIHMIGQRAPFVHPGENAKVPLQLCALPGSSEGSMQTWRFVCIFSWGVLSLCYSQHSIKLGFVKMA